MSGLYDFSAKPKTFWITANRNCNFRCKWCYAECSEYRTEDDIDLDLAKSIVDLAVDMKVKHITIIGGEPTLWKPLFELGDYCKERSMSTGIVTNACMFGDDVYWRKFLASPFKSMGVSIKGINEYQFDKIVGSSNLYRQTMVGLKRLLEYYPEIGVSTVFSDLVSSEEIEEIAVNSFQVSSCSVTLSDGKPDGSYVVPTDRFVRDIIRLYPRINELYNGNILG